MSVVDELTPDQLLTFYFESIAFESWLAARGVRWSRALLHEMMARARDAGADDEAAYWRKRFPPPPPPKRIAERRRKDVPALERLIAERPHWLPRRMRQVFDHCIRDGLTLDACAQQMRIKRETVRTQLRRMRSLARINTLLPR